MLKRKIFKQDLSTSVWEVVLCANESRGRAIAAYDTSGNSLQWNSSDFVDGVLFVNFGVDEHSGVLDYEVSVDDSSDDSTITGDGGVINITVNQTNGNKSLQQ